MRKIASVFAATLVTQLFVIIPGAHATADCTASQFSIEAKHNSVFYFDSPGIMANYVQFKITNKTVSTVTGYYAKIENFSAGSKLSIASYEDASHTFFTGAGASNTDLASNSSVNLYWYLETSGTDNGSTSFDVTIYNSSNVAQCKVTSSLSKLDSTIAANANKLTSVIYSSLPAAAADGSSTFTATVKGQTGTIGAGPSGNKDVNLSPATSANFNAQKFRLSGTSYRCGSSTPVLNQLYIPNACSGNYTAVFTYQYLDASVNASASSTLSPIMQIASGSQMKHTASPSFTIATIGTAPSNQVTTNAASNIFSSSATLNGTIDYGTFTNLYFCWVATTSPGANFSNNCTNKLTATNDGNGNITANLSSLTAGVTYYFELTGETSTPIVYTKGGVLSFQARAVARTDNASSVTSSSATLNGAQTGITSTDVDVSNTLFYYTTSNPGSGHINQATSDTATVTAASSNSVFTASITGLTDGTTYYFEVVVIDINSVSFVGGVKSFTTPGRFTVTFNGNSPTTGSPSSGSVTQGSPGASVTLATEGTLAKTNYVFSGWNTNTGGTGSNYDTNTAYTPTQNITLYAKWVAVPGSDVTITFDPNSGTLASNNATDTGTVTAGGNGLSVKPTSDPTRSGYTFKGWNTDSTATVGLTGTVAANTDLIFYAIWEEIVTPPPSGGGSSAPAPTPPTITSISAPEVCAVTPQLTIRGTYLSSATVKVDGVNASILSASSNEITVSLPSAPVGIKTITVTNNDGSATTTVKYSFQDTPIFVNFTYPETYKNRDFKYVFTADAAAKYEISGIMPSGLALNSLTGELSGAPTQEGTYVFNIVASNICGSTPLIVYMFVDKEIPAAFTCSVAFNNPRTDTISDIKLANLKNCLSPVPNLSPKYVSPVIFLSGGIPAGLTSDQALTHPRYLPIIDLIQSMNLGAQIYYGAFSGSSDSVQLNVYWPDPS